jgi:hypothetical protein
MALKPWRFNARVVGAAVVAFAASFVALSVGCRNGAPEPKPTPQKREIRREVHGYVTVPVAAKRGSGRPDTVLLPDFEVYLRNVASGQESAPRRSNLFGMFVFPPQSAGTYELGWRAQAGWAAGVLPKKVVIDRHVQYPGSVEPKPLPGLSVVAGNVKLADGGSPWFQDASFDVLRTASVSALDAGGNAVGSAVRCNYKGDFAVAGLSPNTASKLRAASQASDASVALSPAAFGGPGKAARIDITLKNRRPRLSAVVATLDGVRVAAPPVGSTLKVLADVKDPDGDPLTFVWRAQAGDVSGDGATVEWTLPRNAGVFQLDVLVSDGKGGDVAGRVLVGGGATGTAFSGRVLDQGGGPVAGAAVWIGGQTPVRTDKSGRFRVETREAKQYVFNVKAAGFALLSKLTQAPFADRTFRLVPAQVRTVSADADIELTDRRPDLERRKMKGASIRVPAGALIDADGKKARGNLTAEIATLDLADDQMPGDLIGVRDGREVGLISFGVIWVEFLDASGRPCQLASGAQAQTTIPVPDSMLAGAPATMPVWSYDTIDGRWKPSGDGALDKATGAYQGKVGHLSTINMDQPGPVSCIRVRTDVSLPAELTLRVSDAGPAAGHYVQQKEMTLEGERDPFTGGLNAVFRCPENRAVHLAFKDREGNSLDARIVVQDGDTFAQLGAPLAGNDVVAGPADANLWPDYPYAGCKPVTIRLKDTWDAYPLSTFLQLAFFQDGGSQPRAAGYYATVAPGANNRLTLADWYARNGFDAAGEPAVPPAPDDYARTSYLNDNDLGSGRDMHFLKRADGTLSAYVTNYSRDVHSGLIVNFDQRLVFGDDALAKNQPYATVCMEYSPVENPATGLPEGPPIVKFFVYADLDGLPGDERQVAADLDGFGGKFVPNLCMNCHGYVHLYDPVDPANPSSDDVDLGSSFRELDVATYRFPAGADLASQQTAFRRQNLMIRDLATPAGAHPVARGPIRDLITGWYASGPDQDNDYTPPAWVNPPAEPLSKPEDLYHKVVKVSCRTCHIAFDSSDDSGGKDWNRYDQMVARHDFIADLAAGSNRIMPHALVTYRNFWLKGIRIDFGAYADPTLLNGAPKWPAIGPP